MLIEFSKIIGLPIYELKNQTKVAMLFDLFVSNDDCQTEAIIAKTASFLGKMKYISKKDVVEISKEAIIIRDDDALVDINELVRLKRKEKERPEIINSKVLTKNGSYVGKVYDFVVENNSLTIIRIYTKKLFDQRIIPAGSIIKLEKNRIIIKDDFEAVREQIIPAGAKTKLA